MAWNTSIFLRNDIRRNDAVQNQGGPNTCKVLLKNWETEEAKRRIYTFPVHRVKIFKINQILVWNQEIPSNELISSWGCLSENDHHNAEILVLGLPAQPTLKASDKLGYTTDVMTDQTSVIKTLMNYQDLVLFPLTFIIYNIILVHCIVWKIICYGLISVCLESVWDSNSFCFLQVEKTCININNMLS